MRYFCRGCKAEYSDRRKALPLREMLKKSKGRTPCPNGCQDCGALIVPEHFSEEEVSHWFHLFSRCPNAKFCCEDSVYRPECEKLVFYPGCLAMLYHGMNDLRYAIEKIHGFDIAAQKGKELMADVMKELDEHG